MTTLLNDLALGVKQTDTFTTDDIFPLFKKQMDKQFEMLMFIGIFALFCAVLGFHIVLEFFRAVANAFKLLWGFAVGVIPGGPQASLVNTFVAMLFSGVAMFGYITMTIFIGEIVTVVFRQQGNGVVAMMSALILMMVAIRLVFAMSKSLKKSSANVASGVISSVGAASKRRALFRVRV